MERNATKQRNDTVRLTQQQNSFNDPIFRAIHVSQYRIEQKYTPLTRRIRWAVNCGTQYQQMAQCCSVPYWLVS